LVQSPRTVPSTASSFDVGFGSAHIASALSPGYFDGEVFEPIGTNAMLCFGEVLVTQANPTAGREKAFQHLLSLQPASIETSAWNSGLRIAEIERPGAKHVGLYRCPGLQIG